MRNWRATSILLAGMIGCSSAENPSPHRAETAHTAPTGVTVNSLSTTDLRAFVPSKDFGVSKAFYQALGFELKWEGDGLAEFQIGDHRFFLQNYYHEGWAKNCMLNLVVEDVAAWQSQIRTANLVERFPGVKASEPQVQSAGTILYLHDPSGVLWHIQQLPPKAG